MTIKKLMIGLATAALMSGAAIAADAGVKAGATVFDTTGGTVGTIEAVNGDLAVVSTGAHKVSVPVSSFGQGTTGPVLAMTKAQLDAAASGAKASADAELKALLTPGASVYGTGGAVVGTVDSVDNEFVTLSVDGQKAKLPLNSVSKGDQGPMVAMSAADLKAALKGSAAPTASQN